MSADISLFHCGIDPLSETEIVDEVHAFNYLVVNLLVNLQADDISATPKNLSQNHSESEIHPELLELLRNRQYSDRDARNFVIEFVLRTLIFTIIHSHFFDGRTFFGIGSDHLRANLERMIDDLRAGGMILFLFILFKFLNILLTQKYRQIRRDRNQSLEDYGGRGSFRIG